MELQLVDARLEWLALQQRGGSAAASGALREFDQSAGELDGKSQLGACPCNSLGHGAYALVGSAGE